MPTGPNPPQPYSTIYFGGLADWLLGYADTIDTGDSDKSQNAIVYIESARDWRPLLPDVNALGQLLANAATHEAGHLLGLSHTQDPRDVMDTTGSSRQMLLRWELRKAPIHQVFLPKGFQNSPYSLAMWLGTRGCYDFIDTGFDYSIQGTTSSLRQVMQEACVDYNQGKAVESCAAGSNCQLLEYSCDVPPYDTDPLIRNSNRNKFIDAWTTVYMTNVDCPNGCSNGRCNPA